MSYIIGTNTNVKATITIYKRCILNPEKNFALDIAGTGRSIENYLATLESQVVNNVNYQKQGLIIDLKLDKNQSGLEMGEDDKDWNYMKIQNGSERPLYYFITNKEWLAKDTIKFSLTMDTLNSFEFNVDYLINKKTNILRQHKDRLKNLGLHYIPDNYDDPDVYVGYDSYTFSGYASFSSGVYIPSIFSPAFHFNFKDGVTKYHLIIRISRTTGDYPPVIIPADCYEMDRNDPTIPAYRVHFTKNFDTGYPEALTEINKFEAFVVPQTDLFSKEIDLYSEGINAPVYKKEKGSLIDKFNEMTWYLLYRNTQTQGATDYINTSPVECFLIPQSSINVLSVGENSFNSGNMTTNTYYLALAYNYYNQPFIIDNETFRLSQVTQEIDTGLMEYRMTYLILRYTGSTIQWRYCQYATRWTTYNNQVLFEDWSVIKSGATSSVGVGNTTSIRIYSTNTDPIQLPTRGTLILPNDTITFTGEQVVSLNNVSTIDRTDSRNIKLLALPYCPSTFINNNNVWSIGEDWQYDSTTKWLKYKNLSINFQNILSGYDYNPFKYKFIDGYGFSPENERNDKYESKLLHSDYFRSKFVYDSFSKVYELEKYDFSSFYSDADTLGYPQNTITFITTRTINSKFVFLFNNEYVINSNLDYDGVCCISRNNEEPLYNSAYINYIRSGYNYDKKSLQRTTEANVFGLGLSIASALIGTIGSVATMNPAGAVLSVAGGGIGIAGQIANTIRTTAQGEQSIQQKLDETSRQAVSVAGSDDIDLLTAYSGNKAKFVEYDISARMKKAIGDLFYYCGYKTDVQGIPNKSSRYWFNFVQAELVINDTANLPNDIDEDIKTRFSQGVTFFHYHDGYDFAQEKENCEVSLL